MLRVRYLIALACLALLSAGANGADIRTYPTRLTLAPGAAIGSIMVKNNDTSPAAVQVDVMRWSQDAGEDKYETSRDLLVNPVIFELAPGAEQVVRVGLQAGLDATERSYRVFFQQLPARDASNHLCGLATRSPRGGGEVGLRLADGLQVVGFAGADHGLRAGQPAQAWLDESAVVLALPG